jgi:hypothetical protein
MPTPTLLLGDYMAFREFLRNRQTLILGTPLIGLLGQEKQDEAPPDQAPELELAPAPEKEQVQLETAIVPSPPVVPEIVDEEDADADEPVVYPEAVERSNYPGDHDYTINAMTEELALMERHLRDGSWKLCDCNPEKHLPTLAGLASEGYGFAETTEEKQFMAEVRDNTRKVREYMKTNKFTERDAEALREWSRQQRHVATGFKGSAVKAENKEDCPACRESVGIAYMLNVAEGLNMPGLEELKKQVLAEEIPADDAAHRIMDYAKQIDDKNAIDYLNGVYGLMQKDEQ